MEENVPKLYDSPLFLFLILLVSLLIWLLKLGNGKKLKLPPSPPKLPIIGNIHQLGQLPHRSLRDLSKTYGPLMLLHLGHTPTLVVSSAEMTKDIVRNHDIVFSNRPKTTAANMLFYGCSDVAFSPYGEYWRQVRKICVNELLSLRRVHSFQFVRDEEVELVTNKIRSASVKGESVNLTEMMLSVANNLVSRCAVNRKFEEDEGSVKFGQIARRMATHITSFSFGDIFPYLRWVDVLTGFIPSLKATSRELDVVFAQLIEEYRASRSPDEISDHKDFVSILFQLLDDGKLEMDLTQDNLKAVILDMLVAGTETTSSTLEWAMAELLKKPSVMNKAQEEVRTVVGKKPKVDVSDINQMEYLKCVVKETLRLHPGAPLLLPRETASSVELGGYYIPANTTVLINAWAIQRDPNGWEKPEEFIPERFENSPVDYKGQDFRYIPFGCGRRSCPGTQFGIAGVEYVIANLLYWFDWKLAAGEIAENLDMSENYGIAVSKKIPLHVFPISHFPI